MTDIAVIYENEDVLVVNKPAGLVVHADGRVKEPTLCEWALHRSPEMKDVGEPLRLEHGEEIPRPGVVHRLDRETSGVITLAKNMRTFLFLKEQFQNRDIEKSYNTFVYGRLKQREGEVALPIGRSARDFRLWTAEGNVRGELREAHTEYTVLEEGKDASFLEVRPTTGRTHQIRVHMKALGHPIVCDRRYAPQRSSVLGFDRLALHARALRLRLPQGTRMTLEAALPLDFTNALQALRQAEE